MTISLSMAEVRHLPADNSAAVVLAAQAGGKASFRRLYRTYASAVQAELIARMPWNQAEDLAHDVFETALRKLDQLRDPAAFPGWLMAVTRNRATDFLRDQMVVEPLANLPIESAESEDLAVLKTIQSLPDAYSETLMMLWVEGMTGPEIASRTGMTQASVRVNLHRGMVLLREALARRRKNPDAMGQRWDGRRFAWRTPYSRAAGSDHVRGTFVCGRHASGCDIGMVGSSWWDCGQRCGADRIRQQRLRLSLGGPERGVPHLDARRDRSYGVIRRLPTATVQDAVGKPDRGPACAQNSHPRVAPSAGSLNAAVDNRHRIRVTTMTTLFASVG